MNHKTQQMAITKNKSRKTSSIQNRPNLKTEKSGFQGTMLNKRVNLSAFILIALFALIAYSNTFHAQMQFDDTLQIIAKSRVNALDNFTSFSDWTNVNKRPLAFFSFAINYYFDEYNVEGYHIGNIIIHILSSFILFILARFIFVRLFPPEDKLKGNLAALFAALIFATHPIQTQGVTYIIQRMTALSTLFYLIAVLSYAYGRIQHIQKGIKQAIVCYFLTAVAFWLSMLSKQIAATLPLALLLFEFFFIKNEKGKPNYRYVIISTSVILVGGLLILIMGFLPKETQGITRPDYLITQFRVIVKYFQLLILPINQNLDYDFPLSSSLWHWKEILGLFFIISITASAIILRKKVPIFAFGILWILLTLLVESSIIPIKDVIFEHRLYLPMAGFALLLSGVIIKFIGQKNLFPAVTLIFILVIIFTSATWKRNQVWLTQRTLWTDVVKKSPKLYRPWYNLGKVAFEEKDLAGCIQFSKQSLEIEPDNPKAWYNIALSYELQGNQEMAVQFYEKSLSYDETFTRSMNNLGSLYINQKEYGKSIAILQKAFEADPKQPSILQNLGVAYFNLNDFDNAIKYNKKYLKIKPDNASILSDIGLSYLRLKNYDKAIIWYKKALKTEPAKISALIDMGTCYFYLNEFQKSADYYQKVLKIDPKNSNALQYLQMAKSRIK